MCFGPSAAEKQAAREQQEAAAERKRLEIEERSRQKREDITEAVEARVPSSRRGSGTGRRSLFSSSTGGSGFIGRFY